MRKRRKKNKNENEHVTHLQTVQRGDDDPGRLALAGQLERPEVLLRRDGRAAVLGQRQRGRGVRLLLGLAFGLDALCENDDNNKNESGRYAAVPTTTRDGVYSRSAASHSFRSSAWHDFFTSLSPRIFSNARMMNISLALDLLIMLTGHGGEGDHQCRRPPPIVGPGCSLRRLWSSRRVRRARYAECRCRWCASRSVIATPTR